MYIYNYSKQTLYEKDWDEVTLVCRGLILDSDLNIVSRPFGKFFNYEEPDAQAIKFKPPFKLYDKMDGSLGISYKVNGKVFIASRGSFTSPQAIEANVILQEKYKDSLDKFEDGKTYLFEIIYGNSVYYTFETDEGTVEYHEDVMVKTNNRGMVRAGDLVEGDDIDI